MSFFNWFSGKSRRSNSEPSQAQHHTRPGRDSSPDSLPQRLAPEGSGSGKLKRHARREQLYVAIREAMTRAGVLSASYKFKVLSLDQPGNEFLVMLDLVKAAGDLPGQIGGIESLIVQNAKARFEITVPAVYWRMEELPADEAPLNPLEAEPTPALPSGEAVAAARPTGNPIQPGMARSRHEPIQADEVAAFKRALQTASPQHATLAAAPGAKKRSGPRSYTLLTGFEETEMSMSADVPALSATQYGDLN